MDYQFFFSYARDDDSPGVRTFFEDLQSAVRREGGLPAGTQLGYFDQRSIELGKDWDHDLVEALQSSKVMVSLGSPTYFDRDYCGREWALFRRRCRAAAVAGVVPPLLKTVMWSPVQIDRLPPEVRTTQLTLGDQHSLYHTKGAHHLLTRERNRDAYFDLVDDLAADIVHAGRTYPLPRLAEVPALADVRSAFHVGAVAPPAPPTVVAGPRQVNCIYVAAHPDSLPAGRRDAYVDVGGGDWRPFFPADERRAHRLMQSFAADRALDFNFIEVPFGTDLIARIDEAERLRQIVVIVIDAWSLHWDAQQPRPAYRDLLQTLDGRIDYHWCVLVPWNDADSATATQGEQIRQAVRRTFDRHARLLPNPMFYREDIRSADQFRRAVTKVLTQLKEEIRRSAPVLRSMPAGPEHTVISGPTG